MLKKLFSAMFSRLLGVSHLMLVLLLHLEEPGGSRRIQEKPGKARKARRTQEDPGRPRSQEGPGRARKTREPG